MSGGLGLNAHECHALLRSETAYARDLVALLAADLAFGSARSEHIDCLEHAVQRMRMYNDLLGGENR